MNRKNLPTYCAADPDTGVMIHRFNPVQRTCECGEVEVGYAEKKHRWRHPKHWKRRSD